MNGPDNLLDTSVEAAPLPEIHNHTHIPAEYFQTVDVADEVFHVIASRSTYDLRHFDERGAPVLAEIQRPLVEADEYYSELNTTSVIQESDFVPFKPRCDVVFSHAMAHSPGNKALQRWTVGVRIGEWMKMLSVTGPRMMHSTLLGWEVAEPQSVTRVPIRYELAWGGTCQWPVKLSEQQEPEILAYADGNPIGTGYVDSAWMKKSGTHKLKAPQLETFNQPFDNASANKQQYAVAGLGVIGRWWKPRLASAGTYDQYWKENRWPKLPKDFKFDYWNGAPADQQIPYPQGGEEVVLSGLDESGKLAFRLPRFDIKLLLHLDAGIPVFKPMAVDTLIFDMKAMELAVVQRALVSAAAKVDMVEIGTWDIAAARQSNARIRQQRQNQGR